MLANTTPYVAPPPQSAAAARLVRTFFAGQQLLGVDLGAEYFPAPRCRARLSVEGGQGQYGRVLEAATLRLEVCGGDGAWMVMVMDPLLERISKLERPRGPLDGGGGGGGGVFAVALTLVDADKLPMPVRSRGGGGRQDRGKKEPERGVDRGERSEGNGAREGRRG